MTPTDPLDAALEKYASNAQNREEILQIIHAVIAHCRQEEALKDKLDAITAAETRVFAYLTAAVEAKLKVNYSPMPPKPRVHVTSLPTAGQHHGTNKIRNANG